MIAEEDVVGMHPTPAFLKVLRLQFTRDEAKLALEIRLSGGTLDELSAKLGIEGGKLEKKLLAMADKGTIVYDPAEEDPVYHTAGMTAGGLTETGVWGGIRFPYTVELGKAIHELMREHGELALANLGVPFTPVWAAQATLPADAAPSENLLEVVKETGHYSVSYCPCRITQALVDSANPCDKMLETCVHTGALSRWATKHGMARELTHDELQEVMRKSNENGLVHTINIFGQICNCCNDCCPIFFSYKSGAPTFIPSPFAAQVEDETCDACDRCVERCPVEAIDVYETAFVDTKKCIGCGVCVPTCKTKSIQLSRRPEVAEVEVAAL